MCACIQGCKYSFIHSGHFYSASSSPLLLRRGPDATRNRILCRSFKPKRSRKLRVKNLSKSVYVAARAGFEKLRLYQCIAPRPTYCIRMSACMHACMCLCRRACKFILYYCIVLYNIYWFTQACNMRNMRICRYVNIAYLKHRVYKNRSTSQSAAGSINYLA